MEGASKLNVEPQDSVAPRCGNNGIAPNIATLVTTARTYCTGKIFDTDRRVRTGASSDMNMSKKIKKIGEPALT